MSSPDHDLPEALFDAVDFGLVVLDADERVVDWNSWIAAASGVAAAAAVGRRLEEIFPFVANSRLLATIGEALRSGVSSVLTHALNPGLLPLHTRAGRDMLHSVTVRRLSADPLLCLVQITDVTVPAEREKILRERQNARYDAVVESAPDAILTLDAEGVIQMANSAAAREFGYARQDLIGRPLNLLFDDQLPWGAWTELVGGGALSGPVELAARRRDGSSSYVELSASRWLSENRIFVTAILRDVNERRAAEEALRALNQTLEGRVAERSSELLRAEEALRQSQKMEALGQLTGGIAHDFNNLLTGIIGSMDILKRRLAANRYDDVDRFMDAAVVSANRAAALTHRLLAFARRQPLDPQPIDVNALILGMEDLLRRSLGEQMKLEIALGEGVWLALTDANQLENALLNLAINSRDAMPDGGRLRIETDSVTFDQSQADQQEEIAAPGDYTVISVSDTGEGMTPETMAKVFDPFFTTKPIGQGTGLGLSMIYGFAKQSRGFIRIESELGQGTTVRLYLPRHRGASAPTSSPVYPTMTPHGSGETVLLVEDDPAVRLLISEVLRELGYASLEAADGQAALPMLASNARLDLMITDVGLPGLNGRQLAEIARQHRPDLKILFVTGYAERAVERGEFLGPGMEMVTKPFALEALALKIREMIKASAA